MLPFTQLLIPIAVATAALFIASFITQTLLPYHFKDFARVPREDELMDAMRPFAPPVGDYLVPSPPSRRAMDDPAYIDKLNKGPIVLMTVMNNRFGDIGKLLAMWVVYLLVVLSLAAHAASRILGYGAAPRDVFHTIGLYVFGAMGLAMIPTSIWYARKWSTTFKYLFDAAIFGIIAGLIFAWLWP